MKNKKSAQTLRPAHFYVLERIPAESEGFEPSVRIDPYVGLANRWFQPLTQLSFEWDAKIQPPNLILQVKTPTFFLFPLIQGVSNP